MINAEAVRNCANYIVDSSNGRIGTVTQIRYDAPNDLNPTALVVRAGRNSTRLLVIPICELTAVIAGRHRVIVHSPVMILGTEQLPSGSAGQQGSV
jgi:hypothetical protein